MATRKNQPKFFINCPFDKDYKPLFQVTIFTILYLDLKPVFSSNISSSNVRISDIMRLIESSNYSIHDLSRNKPKFPNDPVRFNMPFELGLAMGCRRYGGKKHMRKKLLILDKDAHEYDKFIGDISGQDIEYHSEDPQMLMQKIRNWIARLFPKGNIPFEQQIWNHYNQFNSDLTDRLQSTAHAPNSILDLEHVDYMRLTQDWVSGLHKKSS